MAAIAPPIIVDERGDIILYPHIEAAALEIEAIDALAGEYELFDCRGRRLHARALAKSSRVEISATDVFDEPELTRRLRRYVSRVGAERIGISDLESATLEDLVRALAAFFGIPSPPSSGGDKKWAE